MQCLTTGGKVNSSQVKLCFLIGSACSMSQITQGTLRLPFGSACQMSQQIKCIRIQVDAGFIQKSFQSQLHQDLVDLSLSNTFSISMLDSISIKAKSHSAMLINLPTSQQKAMIHFYDGSSQFIVRYIYSLDSEEAHTAISCATKLLSEHLN